MVVLLLVAHASVSDWPRSLPTTCKSHPGKRIFRQYTGRVLRDMEAIPKELRPAYTTVLTDRLPFCSDQELELMRRIVFYSVTIKDIGRVKDGLLYCTTTMGRLKSPLPVATPEWTTTETSYTRAHSWLSRQTPKAWSQRCTRLLCNESPGLFQLVRRTAHALHRPVYARGSRRTFYALGHLSRYRTTRCWRSAPWSVKASCISRFARKFTECACCG